MATAPSFQSFLKKKRHKFNKWNQRWFVLSGNTLSWYAEKTDKVEAGSTKIQAGSKVVQIPLETDCDYQFVVSTPTFRRMFKAETQYELDMWLAALRKVVDDENSKNPSVAPHTQRKKNVLRQLFKKRKSHLVDYAVSPTKKRGAVFGIDLADLATGSPAYLHEWYDYLSRYGLKLTGVFRKPGENNLIKKLRGMYDRGQRFDLVKEVGGTSGPAVHCVASLLKLFFRESQVPLFPEVRNEFIEEVNKQVDEANVVFLLGKVVAEFSKSRQIIIKDLFLFMHKVCLHSAENLMNPNALAVCLTPSLFQTTSFRTLEDLQALKPLTAVTMKYIQFADKISFAGRRASVACVESPITALVSETKPAAAASTASGFTEVSTKVCDSPKATEIAGPDPKSELVESPKSVSMGKPHTKSESTKDPHPKTDSKTRAKTDKGVEAPTIKRLKSGTESSIDFKLLERVGKPRSLSDVVTERARRTKEKLAAAGWESKKTGDGRVFYFHRGEQRSSWSADGIVNCWIQVESKGKIYYYHSHTHERRWDKPEDFSG